MDIEVLQGKKVIAVAAIASPHTFFETLENCGAILVERFPFDDHHFYTRDEIKDLLDKVKEQSAILITSEKDMVKMIKAYSSSDIYYLNIDVVFSFGKDALLEKISNTIHVV